MNHFYEDNEYLIPFSEVSYIDKEIQQVFLKNKSDDDNIRLSKTQCKKLVKKYKKWFISQITPATHEISLQ